MIQPGHANPVKHFRAALALACALACAGPALAQSDYSQAVVQPLPGPESAQLSEALRSLARDPDSLAALLSAGQASLALEDPEAALAFFRRAEAVAPQDGRVKAGVASVMVRRQQPLEALQLFAAAEQAGGVPPVYAAERGLAYDLVGDNQRAQAEYRIALQQGENPAVIRRLALSQAISGDQSGSEATLLPLLQQSDLAAYRTRAFALAILGKPDEAVSIAETMLPARLSGRMAPYLRYMPRLTRAQQATAANLGTFPSAGDIGRDGPTIAAYAAQPNAPMPPRLADARLVPSGVPLGGAADRPAETAPAPILAASRPERVFAQPAVISSATPPASPPQAASLSVPPAPAPAAPPPPSVTSTAALVPAAPAQPSPPAVTPALQAPAPQSPAPQPVKLADAFAEFSSPGSAPRIVAPAAGAVDITTIEPRRERPAPPPEAAKPAPPKPRPVPSRHWVQIATGRNVAALAFDWRRLKREASGLLDRAKPNTAKWGQTNRLVVGPFPTTRAADDLIDQLKDKKFDSFRFTSAAGEEVKPLD